MWCPGFIVLVLALAIAATEQQETDQVAELFLVVERSAVYKYIKNGEVNSYGAAKRLVKQEIGYFLTEISKLLATIQGQNIKLGLRKLKVLNNNIIKGEDGAIHTSVSLQGFEDYLNNSNAFSKLKYDMALLFTGFDLHMGKGTSGTAGLAYHGAICGEYGVGLVEFAGNYGDVITAAHEIGHILGADHDPDGAGYVMSPASVYSSSLRWQFSSLSSTDITATLSGKTCLTETSSDTVIPNKSAPRTMQDPNTVCVRNIGKGAYFFHAVEGTSHGDALCLEINCADGKSNNLYPVVSSEGLICGAGKACNKGKCVVDPNSNSDNLIETCLFGDQKQVDMGNESMSCPDVIRTGQWGGCREQYVRAQCCQSCGQEETGDPNCPFGEVKTINVNNEDMTCQKVVDDFGYYVCGYDYWAKHCCETCKGHTEGHSVKRELSKGDLNLPGLDGGEIVE